MRSHPWRNICAAGYPSLAIRGEAFAGQSIHWIDCLIRLTLFKFRPNLALQFV
jgi:hypothetical protein